MKKLIPLTICFLLPAFAAAHHHEVDTSRRGARILPLPKAGNVFHFIIFGDRTGGPAAGINILKQAVKDTNLLDPDLVMTVGDLVEGYNTAPGWLKQMKEYRQVMKGLKMPWFPVAGNHDIYWRGKGRPPWEHEKNYEKHFGPLWYSFEHKNAGFVVLYTDEGDPKTGERGSHKPSLIQMSPKQLSWLAKSLQKLKAKDHVFVFLHHPRWVEQWYRGSNWDKVHQLLAKAGNVRAVFAGHIHRMRYDGKKDGIEYFSLATTGGGIPGNHPKIGYLHHMNLVTVRDKSYSVAALPVGAVIDPRQFTALRQKDVDLLRKLAVKRVSAPLQLGLHGEAAGYYRVRLANPASRPIDITLGIDATEKDWFFTPDHRHLRLQPGADKIVEFAYARRTAPFPANFRRPVLTLNVDYLEEGSRIRIPTRQIPADIGLRKLPRTVHEAGKNGVFQFTGKTDCLRVDAFDLPDGPFTLEAWVHPTRHSKAQALLAKTENSGFALFLYQGRPSFNVHLNGKYSSAQSNDSLPLNRWTHLAGVYDGREVRLYVNGKNVAAKPATGKRTRNQLPFYIAADTDRNGRPTSFFAGQIDEVRLSRGPRYRGASFVPAERHASDSQTVLLFHCDRFVGPFAVGESNPAVHAQRVGGPAVRMEKVE